MIFKDKNFNGKFLLALIFSIVLFLTILGYGEVGINI